MTVLADYLEFAAVEAQKANLTASLESTVALSQAISLKRIADLMEPQKVALGDGAWPDMLREGAGLRGKQTSPEIASIASRLMDITGDNLTSMGSVTAHDTAMDIRKLAASALGQVNE